MSSETISAKRIAMENLKPGMILARDLVDKSGKLLLSKDTALSKENFNTIMLSANPYVFVLESSIYPDRPSFLDSSQERMPVDIPVKERESFIEFEKEYETKPDELKDEFKVISEGGKIDQDKLFSMTDSIMSHLGTKNDVFTYLSNLMNRDEPTYAHSVNVSLLANLFGVWVNASSEEVYNLTNAALLHDIGKTQIPDEVLNKKGRLSKSEYDEIKKHTILGYRILETSNLPKEVKLTALGHHEKIDGSGYPLGLKGDKISKFAKIVSICDIYDAMTSNRVYRQKICPFDVIKSFEQGSYGVLDTEMLLLFLQNIAYTYLNSKVKLSNGVEGEIVFINRSDLSNPIIKTVDEEIIDLKSSKDIHIVTML